MKLSKRSIERLRYDGDGKEPVRYSDTEIRGLSLRIYPSGRKKFWLRYRVDGRRRELALGDYGPLTPEQARSMALEKMGGVAQGQDPLEEIQRDKQRGTINDLAKAYIDGHAKPNKRSWKTDEARLEKYVKPAIGNLKPASVSRQDISRLHQKIGVTNGKPYEANRVLALVRFMLNKGQEWGHVPEGHPNPCRLITPFEEKARTRFLGDSEIMRLQKAVAAEDSIYFRGAIWLYLLTGLRKLEVLRLGRSEIADWDRGLVILRMSKSKKKGPDVRSFGEAALAVLRVLPEVDGNEFFFPSTRSKSGHMMGFRKRWNKVRAAAGLEDVVIHDLRRTVGSRMASGGESMKIVASVLGQASSRIAEEHYAHLSPSPVQDAANRYGDLLVKVAGVDPAKAVSGEDSNDD
ncbi:MAG: hypothetical protein AUK47_04355 [Deltaproteobacteria bacterium CG2_30_63_29]|nr:MAG: hypothetical protein AUK47_04355 [Deltaproteobacteria bacterium CG2_30_63_29]